MSARRFGVVLAAALLGPAIAVAQEKEAAPALQERPAPAAPAPATPEAKEAAPATRVFHARETAHVLDRFQWSVGVFNPLSFGLGDGYELRGHPLLFLVSPNAILRKEHLRLGAWTITGEYGLSVPTFVLRLTRGYLFPSGTQIPWLVVPRVGAVATFGDPSGSPLSLSADFAFGLRLGGQSVPTLETYAPLEVLLAPALGGHRTRVGVQYDHRFLAWLRARGYADLYVHGSSLGTQLTGRAGVGVDVAVFSKGRVTAGVVWWNSNQFAWNPETGEHVRSNDFYPTLDFIWGG